MQFNKNNLINQNFSLRAGLKDMWNSFMVHNCSFSKNDIPICKSTVKTIPKYIITYEEAKHIYKQNLLKKNYSFYENNTFVCFYIDDQKFDSIYGIWFRPYISIRILKHFKGIITPDFSTYTDFPFPIKIYNTYRMRAFGCYISSLGIEVINNVRWGTKETYQYCFDGIPFNSIITIGTVGSNLKNKSSYFLFEKGFKKMIKTIRPKIIIIYGSSNYPCFKAPYLKNIKVISYASNTCKYFKKRYNIYE